MSDLVLTAVMDKSEALEWKATVGESANQLRLLLLDGYERQAWKALGFADWTTCLKALADEFDLTERRLWQLHAANQTERLLNNCSVGTIPEGQLRPLTRLEPDLQPIVWQQAVETAPNGKVTAAHVQSVVNEYQAKPHVANNSGNNEWYTPSEYIEAARSVLGNIDLDPASSDEANQVVQADTYYTIEDDGLAQSWSGRVWMNPPYASDLIGKFAERLAHCYQSRDVKAAIVLVNNATETRWFQSLAEHATAICFPLRRVSFWSPNGGIGAPLQGQAIIYLGNNTDDFIERFWDFGILVRVA